MMLVKQQGASGRAMLTRFIGQSAGTDRAGFRPDNKVVGLHVSIYSWVTIVRLFNWFELVLNSLKLAQNSYFYSAQCTRVL